MKILISSPSFMSLFTTEDQNQQTHRSTSTCDISHSNNIWSVSVYFLVNFSTKLNHRLKSWKCFHPQSSADSRSSRSMSRTSFMKTQLRLYRNRTTRKHSRSFIWSDSRVSIKKQVLETDYLVIKNLKTLKTLDEHFADVFRYDFSRLTVTWPRIIDQLIFLFF